MITTDGWLDWAERVPGHSNKTNSGLNSNRGIFLHSAEGYEAYLRSDPPKPVGVSWHLSNLFNGHLLQHYPLTTRCWHATAANNSYLGFEHEGKVPNHPTLAEPQINTAVRVIREISVYYGWKPKRPISGSDVSHTLWEHNEVVRLGGTGSACPSGRIPWNEILKRLNTGDDDMLIRHNGLANPGFWNGRFVNGEQLIDARSDFSLPLDTKLIRYDLWLDSGVLDVADMPSGNFAGSVGGSAAQRVAIDAFIDQNGIGKFFGLGATIHSIGIVGYWK